MFVIDPHDPMRVQLVGKPASTLGHIPVSVTYSKELNIGECQWRKKKSHCN